jgi:hypothetical protein
MRDHGNLSRAALRSGMDRKTARKYLRQGRLPSALKGERTWRTRPDPFEEDWAEIARQLGEVPELEATTIFEELLERHPDRYREGQLRTLQRRIKQWRAEHGPDKEVFFVQRHRPGEAMQTDFTHATALGVTIAGESFAHLLCHPVLPFSNWEWVTVCRSESMAALRRGVQEAVFRLGAVPQYHQTDNSTAATHDLGSGKRAFNAEYLVFCEHLGMTPRTTGIGEKEQNGDVESLHGSLKRWLKQQLLRRGSRDFESRASYERWLWEMVERRNRRRAQKLREELEAMRPLRAARLPEYRELTVTVRSGSTIRVKNNTYSVPSRLIGERVRVRIFDERLEVHYGGRCQLVLERLRGEGGHRIEYRHVIDSLVRKPGAFERYRYRQDLFPTLIFRRSFDRLHEQRPAREADLHYLRLLRAAARCGQTRVEQILESMLAEGAVLCCEAVRERLEPAPPPIPVVAPLDVDLEQFDALLCQGVLS